MNERDDQMEVRSEEQTAPANEQDDRRKFLKGLIAGAAAASLGAVGTVGTASASPGRKLPLLGPPGEPTTLAFANDLAQHANVDPTQWGQIETTLEQYLGPLVDTGEFLAVPINISVLGNISISLA